MARFDIYPNPGGTGYLLDVQADLLEDLNTRVVVPLMPVSDAPVPARRLNPVLEIRSEPYVMVTQFISAVPVSILKAPVGTLAQHDSELVGAIDILLTGV